MKPLETPAAVAAQQQAAAAAARQSPESELAQRLWQLLLPLPELGTAAADSSASLEQSQSREHDARDRDATGQLTSMAYLLASAVQQLGLVQYRQLTAADTPSPQRSASYEGSFTMHVSSVDANGGTASLEVINPQLGDITLEVELDQGTVHVVASAPNEHSARVLEANQAVLAERLLRQGVVLAKLDVVVRSRAGRGSKRPRKRERRRENEP
jgi:flagellar hook-length control protein FliK